MAEFRQASTTATSGTGQYRHAHGNIPQHRPELPHLDSFAGLHFPPGNSFQLLPRGSDGKTYWDIDRHERNQDQAYEPFSEDNNFMYGYNDNLRKLCG